MFNVGPGELLAIFTLALVVLGPKRLPDAVRHAGRIYGHVRRVTTGFQDEIRRALDAPPADPNPVDEPEPESVDQSDPPDERGRAA